MKIKVSSESKLKPLTFFSVSSDPVKDLQYKTSESGEFEWTSSSFYL
jgi:hypothetical protein